MNIKNFTGVIFDFNGTLFWDTKLHNEAWDIFLRNYNISMTDEEKSKTIHGKTNKEILKLVFNASLNDELLHKYINEKETVYRELCIKSNLNFASGAVNFLQFLQQNSVEYAIATSSGQENIGFYINYLKLENWFERDKIIYNNGSIKSKPDPEIFQVAMKRLGKNPEEVVIFEDSYAGIAAAENAGAGKIIIVNSNDEDYSGFNYEVISNYEQVDRNIFVNK